MYIGITYNLAHSYSAQGFSEQDVSSFMLKETLHAIETALISLGHRTHLVGDFIGLINSIQSGQRWDLVFNIADGTMGTGREALIPAVLDSYNIPYTFSDPLSLTICTHKGMTKRIVRENGIKTPSFVIVEKKEDIERVNIPYPLFIKPLMGGRSLGVNDNSYIEDPKTFKKNCAYLLDTIRQPILVETYLPGREFSIGIMGSGKDAKILGIVEVELNDKADRYAFSRLNKVHAGERVQYLFPEDEEASVASELALKAWNILGCRDLGRIDVRSDQHHQPNFIEANPIPGLHPEHSIIAILLKKNNISYRDLIKEIISYK